jgi:hypothetical protein
MKKQILIAVMIIINCFLFALSSPNNFQFEIDLSKTNSFQAVNYTEGILIDYTKNNYNNEVEFNHYVNTTIPYLSLRLPDTTAPGVYLLKATFDDMVIYNERFNYTGYVLHVNNLPNPISVGSHYIRIEVWTLSLDRYIDSGKMYFSVLPENKVLKNCMEDELYILNETTSTTKKPILIVEGFDPNNTNNLPEYLDLLNPF